jgi:hypothetical protein
MFHSALAPYIFEKPEAQKRFKALAMKRLAQAVDLEITLLDLTMRHPQYLRQLVPPFVVCILLLNLSLSKYAQPPVLVSKAFKSSVVKKGTSKKERYVLLST